MPRRKLTDDERRVSQERKRLRKLELRRQRRREDVARTAALLVEVAEAEALDHDLWGFAVTHWNEQGADYQRAARMGCRERGHRWAVIPIGKEVCTKCFEYRDH